jgi:hypothetical protein
MNETKTTHLFNIKPIICDVEKVIQDGINKILANHMDRYNLLEKTHQQIMRLPSIRQELNKNLYDSDYETDIDSDKYLSSTNKNIKGSINFLENRLDKLENKYDTIIPVLDKILNKITKLSQDINELQNINKNILDVDTFHKVNIQKSSVIKTSENENIEINVEEPTQVLNKEELDDSDEDDLNPALITCSTITLQDKEKESIYQKVEKSIQGDSTEEEEDDELSVGEELGEHNKFIIKENINDVEDAQDDDVDIEPDKTQDNKVDDTQLDEADESQDDEADESQGNKADESQDDEVEESQDDEADESQDDEVEESQDDEADESQDDEADESQDDEADESQDDEADESQDNKGDKSQDDEVEESQDSRGDKSQEDEVEESEKDEASIETETKEEEEDEEELFEIEIDDKTYCTNDDQNGFIWELTEDGEQGDKIGYLKEGDAYFYEDEK